MSAAPAHADPRFVLPDSGRGFASADHEKRSEDAVSFTIAEAEARAGDTVHFSISGAEGRVDYEVEIEDVEILKGRARGAEPFVDQFTMPDLGESGRTITVEAEIEDGNDATTVKRKLQYLGVAGTVGGPSEISTAAPPEMLQEAPLATAQPGHGPDAGAAPVPGPTALTRQSSSPARNGRGPHTSERQRHSPAAGRSGSRASRKRASRGRRSELDKRRRKRRGPRQGFFLYGVPQPPGSESPAGAEEGFAALNAIAPRTAFLSGAVDGSGKAAGITPSLLVPAVLGLAALALAGTAMLRRRRLATTERGAESSAPPR